MKIGKDFRDDWIGLWMIKILVGSYDVFQKLGYSGQRESALDVDETGNEKTVDWGK